MTESIQRPAQQHINALRLQPARALTRGSIDHSRGAHALCCCRFTAHKLEAGSKANKVLAIHLAADVWFHAQVISRLSAAVLMGHTGRCGSLTTSYAAL